MYGLVNLAIEEAILERYGQNVWELIKREAALSDMDEFLGRVIYDDEITYQLIEAAERVLKDKPYGRVSQMIGEKFYELVLPGYERVLKLLGGNLMEFLDNLDALHDHLQSRDHLKLRPPSFRCTTDLGNDNNNNQQQKGEADKVGTILYLHYYSDRVGLEGIVMGMVKAAARELHRLRIDIELKQIKPAHQLKSNNPVDDVNTTTTSDIIIDKNNSNSNNDAINVDHSIFKITLLSLYAQNQANINVKQLLMPDESFTYKDCPQLDCNLNRISPLVFAQALPFHLVFDRQLTVLQAGTSIIRVLPSLNKPGTKLTSIMRMIKPMNVELTFDNILKYINTVFVMRPDEAQVISSGGHRHLQQLYLDTLQEQTQQLKEAAAGGQLPASLENFDSRARLADITNQTNPPTHIAPHQQEQQASVAPGEAAIHQFGEQHQHVNTTSEGTKFTLSYQLPMEDLNKYIVKLKGQMIYMENRDLILFVCSPSVVNLNELNDTGLYLSDIPLHDATRDLVLLSEQFDAEYKLTRNLEILTGQLHSIYAELKDEKKKTDSLLYSVLPPSVANELRHHRQVPAKRFTTVTILFSGIVGFGEFCAKNSDSDGAIRIVNLLNKIYTTFDVLTEPETNPNVYKVETVGDKYMAVSGLPEPCESHAKCINRLALDLMDLCKTIKLEEYTGIKPVRERNCLEPPTQMDHCEHLRVTIGIHCGEVVTGVIGKRTPRYCLFGNTVNLTSRCETTGEKGAINVSQDVYEICMKDKHNYDPEFKFRYRGEILMKGRSEPMQMWYLTRRDAANDDDTPVVPFWPERTSLDLSDDEDEDNEMSRPPTPPEDTSV